MICQDEMATSRLQEELESFLGVQIPILPERELTFVEASGVSRQWEQKRLKLLYDLAAGKLPLVISSAQALSLRTMPREVFVFGQHSPSRGRKLLSGGLGGKAHAGGLRENVAC